MAAIYDYENGNEICAGLQGSAMCDEAIDAAQYILSVQLGTGGWESRAEFPVPQDADAGTYVIEHKVKAGSSYDKRVSVFVVS